MWLISMPDQVIFFYLLLTTQGTRHILYIERIETIIERSSIMKTLIVKENVHGRTTKVNAKTTYQTDSGKWVAEVDGSEFRNACVDLCQGLEDCTCDDLHVEADLDDDGKEYRITTS